MISGVVRIQSLGLKGTSYLSLAFGLLDGSQSVLSMFHGGSSEHKVRNPPEALNP